MKLKRLLVPHELDEECNGDHCYICDVDEPGTGYRRCFECNHLYRSRRDLRHAYRQHLIGGMLFSRNKLGIPTPFWRSNSFGPSTVRTWWMMITIRAEKIHFCQHCTHDF